MSPSLCCAKPSSDAAHNIPCDGIPLSFAFFILKLFANTAPTIATGTFIPTRTFAAPHTIAISSLAATSTIQRRSLSALGWGETCLTSPMTTPLNLSATALTPSTSSPAKVNFSINASVDSSGLTHSRNQFSLNFMLYQL